MIVMPMLSPAEDLSIINKNDLFEETWQTNKYTGGKAKLSRFKLWTKKKKTERSPFLSTATKRASPV